MALLVVLDTPQAFEYMREYSYLFGGTAPLSTVNFANTTRRACHLVMHERDCLSMVQKDQRDRDSNLIQRFFLLAKGPMLLLPWIPEQSVGPRGTMAWEVQLH